MGIRHVHSAVAGEIVRKEYWNDDHQVTTNVDFNSKQINSLADPTLNQDAATKKYVDNSVAIPHGTYYWSCSGANFHPAEPDVNDVIVQGTVFEANVNGIFASAPIFLPHGAVVTGAVVYGSISDETWIMDRITFSDRTRVEMARAVFNTEDTSISSATIDNSLYGYAFRTTGIDDNDEIWGARITYTI